MMTDVNILSITALQFRLPDDFDGTLADALFLLAEYHASAEDRPASSKTDADPTWYDGKTWREVNILTFDRFIDLIREGGRLYGLMKTTKCVLTDVEAVQ